jgi:hypothetical protein
MVLEYKLGRFDKIPFGKYKNSKLNVVNLIFIDLNYVLWLKDLPNIKFSNCVLKTIDKKLKIDYDQKIEELQSRRYNKRLLTDDFLEFSGLEEAFRGAYFN